MSGPLINKAGRLNLLIQQGSTFERTLRFTDFEISEYLFRGQIRREHKSRNPIVHFSFDILDEYSLRMYLLPAQTELLKDRKYIYDIEMYTTQDSEDTYVARILEGKIDATPEVTKNG